MRKIALIWAFCLCLARAEELYASFDVVALHQSKLALELSGIVSKINVEVADKVKKNDILLELDTTSEQIALANAKNDYELALVAYKNQRARFQRFKEVGEFIDKQSLEDIKASYDEARLKLKKAELSIKHYENIIEKKTLRAPYDGIISAKFVNLGQAVGQISQNLFEIFSYPQVKLILSFDEKYKDRVKVGQKFIYEIAGEQKEGQIHLIYPSIDIKTRKIYAEVLADDLTPGFFAEGYIIIE